MKTVTFGRQGREWYVAVHRNGVAAKGEPPRVADIRRFKTEAAMQDYLKQLER
jgi:hypothetical protein